MELRKPETTKYVLFTEWRDYNLNEQEFEKAKLACDPILHIIEGRLQTKHKLKFALRQLDQSFSEFDKSLKDMDACKIEHEKNLSARKGSLYEQYIQNEHLVNNTIESIDQQIQELITKSAELTIELKSKLRQCLKKQLPEFPESTINSIFNCNDVYEVLDFFESDDEFAKLAKTKVENTDKIDSELAYEFLAKAIAIKTVGPMHSGDARTKQIKANLKAIKSCINAAKTELASFIEENDFKITKEQAQIIGQLSEQKASVDKLITNSQKREIIQVKEKANQEQNKRQHTFTAPEKPKEISMGV